jgi:hypothetical protein
MVWAQDMSAMTRHRRKLVHRTAVRPGRSSVPAGLAGPAHAVPESSCDASDGL